MVGRAWLRCAIPAADGYFGFADCAAGAVAGAFAAAAMGRVEGRVVGAVVGWVAAGCVVGVISAGVGPGTNSTGRSIFDNIVSRSRAACVVLGDTFASITAWKCFFANSQSFLSSAIA